MGGVIQKLAFLSRDANIYCGLCNLIILNFQERKMR